METFLWIYGVSAVFCFGWMLRELVVQGMRADNIYGVSPGDAAGLFFWTIMPVANTIMMVALLGRIFGKKR